jgi:hypothetical protein
MDNIQEVCYLIEEKNVFPKVQQLRAESELEIKQN